MAADFFDIEVELASPSECDASPTRRRPNWSDSRVQTKRRYERKSSPVAAKRGANRRLRRATNS